VSESSSWEIPTGLGLVAVATDRSEGARHAVKWATDLARSLQAELVAIQVAANREGPNGTGPAIEAMRADLEGSLPDDLSTTARVAVGDDIAATIVSEAEKAGAEMIVVGSSGMRERKEFLLGNVANRVTHIARCTVVVVNTATGAPLTVEPDSEELRGRAEEIARALGPVAVRQLSGRALRSEGDPEGPRKLREGLERLGPTFGKLGQILSTRPDLLPDEYLDELASLQSAVPPMAEAEVVAVMEAELGVPWEDVFSSIEPEPLAAGTIGQVHRAKMVDGHPVVVKVQRPTAAALVDQDLRLLQMALRPAARSRRVRRVIDLPSLVEQLSTSLRAELDFGEEAANLERMAEILQTYGRVAVPDCWTNLSTPRLLVMDEVVGGVPLSEAPPGEARTEATRELLQVYYRQVLEEGFFHADPHPGNLLWAGEKIWMLDLGMVGTLDAQTRRHLMLVMLSFVEGDVDLLVDVALDLAGADESLELDRSAYRRDLEEVVAAVRGRSLAEIHIVELLNELTAISVRHGVPLPSGFVMVGKALSQVEQTVTELAPEIDPFDEARKFFLRSIRRRVFDRIDSQQIVYEAERFRYRLTQIGDGLATILGNRPGRRMEVRFTSKELERRIMRTGRLVALGLSAGLTWIAATEATSSERVDPATARRLRGLASGLSAWFALEAARRK